MDMISSIACPHLKWFSFTTVILYLTVSLFIFQAVVSDKVNGGRFLEMDKNTLIEYGILNSDKFIEMSLDDYDEEEDLN